MSWRITPTQPVPVDPQYGRVSLLLHGNGTNGSTTITDSSPTPKTVTAVGNAQISTAQSKFGGASIAFDGGGDYLTIFNPDFAFDTGNFTIELWIMTSSMADDGIFQISNNPLGFKTTYESAPLFSLQSGVLNFGLGPGSATVNTGINISDSQWHHIAMSRSGSLLKIFIDGITVASVANSINCTGQYLVVGGYYSTVYTLLGYIDDLRITKGIARYTANFTPPTAPFPDI
jgi:hypothetical protein